ncbi:MAG: PVC-type heme-binding CxxCH protein [Planctomycetaceae bacterium]
MSRFAAATRLLLVLTTLTSACGADEFTNPRNTEPGTTPLLTHDEAVAAIKVPDGFHVSLFAAEPDVQNPIAFCTDTRGRLWVAENYTYAERELNFDLTLNDRILIFEDTNGDGRHDSRKVFWDRGKKLTSVQVGLGGVWVTCAPHLLFIPDRNGDDIPDGEPEVVLDGFDAESIRHNIVNGLKWGPDGWLYGRHGIQATSKVGRPGTSESERVSLNCCVWRYHPLRKTFEVVTQGTTNPWGMDWDVHGECWLINTVIGHLWHVVPGAYWKRMYGSHFNPHLYELIDQTADHIHWNSAETWSDVRKEFSSTTNAAGGGHAHVGLLCTDATWPKEYRNSIVAGNLHGRRLNRDVLEREGCGYAAHHAADFFFSSDPYFRTLDLEHARDGGMFLADWSDIGECHENDGVHRGSGRIFKLTWDGMTRWQHDGREAPGVPATEGKPQWQVVPEATKAADLAKLPASQLVALQRHPDEWYARTARRVLQERAVAGTDLDDAAQALEWLIDSDESAVTTLRAMWGLDVIGSLSRQRLLGLLKHSPNEYVRTNAVRLLVSHPDHARHLDQDRDVLTGLAKSDPSGRVRLEIASALSAFPAAARLQIAGQLAIHQEDVDDHQQPLMIWYGIESAVPVLPEASLRIAAETPMLKLAGFIARRLTHDLETHPERAAQLVDLLKTVDDSQASRRKALLEGMSAALQGWRKAQAPAEWEAVAAMLAKSSDADVVRLTRELSLVFGDGRAVDELRAIVKDGNVDAEARRTALRSLIEARVDGLEEMLKELINNRDFTTECIRGLAACGGPQTPQMLVNRYGGLRLEAKEVAIGALVSRPDFVAKLLQGVDEGKVPRQDVLPFQLRQMLSYDKAEDSARIHKLWPELQQLSDSKQQRIRELTAELPSATIEQGDRPHGRALFSAACAKCHKLFGEGGTTAPELTGAQRTNLAYLLENIVDPSATISKNYQMSIVLLDDGRVLNGVVVNPTERTITLNTPNDTLVLDRDSIEDLRETNLSLMPEGQLDRLNAEEVRDLIAYLMSPTQVKLPQQATKGR